ncbi:MAG: hypothetical protein IPP06_00410 [Saprospiraceae bacterium]|nr:hypothetical protein [Candidatus Vicinibacter affinis]MBP6172907.1 hypothetical protein [Saprospiraceae bacterium]MBK6572971.1 hypothetical protein [Candidatus Vicinibacter affinis]MBK6822552.1 hypothetical protein [Candidatus Vicinibacter affinis]MBK7301661.1 hypothetical protein [Candidatus Vicinibacter affinis]
MKYLLIVVVLITLMSKQGNAQAKVQINADPSISAMMNQYLRINKSITHISGWRITVITTVDRRQMEATRIEFQKQFSFPVKWEYKEPYYHLKAGAFLNRNDAASALENIKKKFNSAFLSIDKIQYNEL